MKKLILIIAALVLLPSAALAQTDAEREAVKQAVMDYVEGIYTVDASRIERSVHPELAKRGFFVKKGETAYSPHVMTFQQLVDLAKYDGKWKFVNVLWQTPPKLGK